MERRRFPRVATNVKVRFTLADMQPGQPLSIKSEASDASFGGVSFNTPHPLLPGTPLRLEFLLDDGADPPRLVKAEGMVRWCRLGKPPVAMGVRFTRFDDGGEGLYMDWLADMVEQESGQPEL